MIIILTLICQLNFEDSKLTVQAGISLPDVGRINFQMTPHTPKNFKYKRTQRKGLKVKNWSEELISTCANGNKKSALL